MIANKYDGGGLMRSDELGERLADLRIDMSLSQRSLGKTLRISSTSIAYYETGERALTLKALEAYHNFFDVSYDYLMGKTNNKKREHIDIGEKLGLSDKSIEILEYQDKMSLYEEEYYFETKKEFQSGVNLLVENKQFLSLVSALINLRNKNETIKNIKMTKELHEFLYFDKPGSFSAINEQLKEHLGENYYISYNRDIIIQLLKNNAQDIFNNILNDIVKSDNDIDTHKEKNGKIKWEYNLE
jgi:transcriptional regulator with XRE-family HTH domain